MRQYWPPGFSRQLQPKSRLSFYLHTHGGNGLHEKWLRGTLLSPYQEDGPAVMATKTGKGLDKAAKSKEICLGRSLKLARRRNERNSKRLAKKMRPPKPCGSITSSSPEAHRAFEEGFLPSRARTNPKLAFSYFFSYFNRYIWFNAFSRSAFEHVLLS